MCGCWHGPAAITRSIFVAGSDIGHCDIHGTSEGIHLAAMASSVDLLQRCYTRPGNLSRSHHFVSPHWPESAPAPGFPIRYRSHRLYLRVSGKGGRRGRRGPTRRWADRV